MDFIAVVLTAGSHGSSEHRIEELAESCLRFTPDVSIVGETIFLEVSRCLKLYRKESLRLRIQTLCDRFWLQAKMGMGSHIGEALCQARYGTTQRQKLPVEALLDYALLDQAQSGERDYESERKLRRDTRFLIETVKKLGVLTLAYFVRFPVSTGFGALGARLQALVARGEFAPCTPLRIKPTVMERELFEPVGTFDEIAFYLKTIMDRAMARLRGRSQRASCIKLSLALDWQTRKHKNVRTWTLPLANPQSSTLALLQVIREKISAELLRSPLSAPVIEAEFEVLETVPGSGSQRHFFDRREEQEEAWNTLLFRLLEKLGSQGAFVAEPAQSYFPERSWRRALSAIPSAKASSPRFAAEGLARRPLRVLKRPERVTWTPGRLFHPQQVWDVVFTEGPERIESDWWLDSLGRDYYRVATQSGEVLWIYKTRSEQHPAEFYLHGYFD